MKKGLLMFITLAFMLFVVSIKVNAKVATMDESVKPIHELVSESGSGSMYSTTQSDYSQLGNLVTNQQYTSSRFRVGIIEHYYKYTVNSIKRYYGVYSNYFGGYYTKSVLESGSVTSQLTTTRKYQETEDYTYYFSRNMSYSFEANLYASTNYSSDGLSASGDMKAKSSTDISYSYNYLYTRKSFTEMEYSGTMIVDSLIAAYCPAGYSISIGEVGYYYVLDITYTEYEIWWWGTKVTGSSNRSLKIVGVNEDTLTTAFIYIKQNDPNSTYYLI
ncbi:hypothetical protein N7603_05665 [Acholeplasma vituli]|uniref:Uncharacterized protein n=1 Tax=Paracholeplasma vituli TaxID=69473 RepID=A0ABT2PXT3_9MOLU|nr:hypothetical protein [Paracholeplasma vituli]MCU0105139.1 hypothetical protein [Paracholeplasma vituli]